MNEFNMPTPEDLGENQEQSSAKANNPTIRKAALGLGLAAGLAGSEAPASPLMAEMTSINNMPPALVESAPKLETPEQDRMIGRDYAKKDLQVATRSFGEVFKPEMPFAEAMFRAKEMEKQQAEVFHNAKEIYLNLMSNINKYVEANLKNNIIFEKDADAMLNITTSYANEIIKSATGFDPAEFSKENAPENLPPEVIGWAKNGTLDQAVKNIANVYVPEDGSYSMIKEIMNVIMAKDEKHYDDVEPGFRYAPADQRTLLTAIRICNSMAICAVYDMVNANSVVTKQKAAVFSDSAKKTENNLNTNVTKVGSFESNLEKP